MRHPPSSCRCPSSSGTELRPRRAGALGRELCRCSHCHWSVVGVCDQVAAGCWVAGFSPKGSPRWCPATGPPPRRGRPRGRSRRSPSTGRCAGSSASCVSRLRFGYAASASRSSGDRRSGAPARGALPVRAATSRRLPSAERPGPGAPFSAEVSVPSSTRTCDMEAWRGGAPRTLWCHSKPRSGARGRREGRRGVSGPASAPVPARMRVGEPVPVGA